MRAKEFIVERAFSGSKSSTMPTTYTYPEMPSADPYKAYRFAMAMANHELKHQEGPTSRNAVIVAYSDGDDEIIKAAEKRTGRKGQLVSDKKSREPNETETVSPVAKPKRNKYGV